MRVVHNAPLAPLTTLRLGGSATRLVTVERERDAVDAVREEDERGEALLVLGGGSNLVISDAGFAGTVVRMATRGLARSSERAGRVHVTAEAGEPWDDFVTAAVEEGLSGVECLAGIPGLVGAVPMQNVGAYGQDVGETIVTVRAYDRARREIVELPREACAFAYRSSAFRGKDRHVILSVTFALEKRAESGPIRYAELSRALAVAEGARAPLEAVRSTVVALRRKKGMVLDPADPDTTSAGSFFTNPIVSASDLESVRALARDEGPMPVFPEPDGRFKLSAGWLIERAGFAKGFAGEGGRAAVSSKHALALTNRGGATTRELVALARRIREGVRARFGVTLENEPVFVGERL
ncbi:MAG: UDP-N-acetylmuramate dehydrogenase [Labilithrix sp.]|nr:UDP-N-acetylmuramate dehydrogenase [Labilithrix sp.]